MRAVLESAEALFSTRGVNAVSIRDIAAKAGVNHGLIHRHFGSKEKLRKAVQDRLSQRIRDDIGEPRDARDGFQRGFRSLQTQKTYWKLMAMTILEDGFQGNLQSEYPYVRRMTELVEKAQKEGRLRNDLDPRVIVAGGFALGLGLMLFERYILPGVGLDQEPTTEAMRKIAADWMDMLNVSTPDE